MAAKAILAILVLASVLAANAEPPPDPRFSEKAEKAAEEQSRLIRSVARLFSNHPWAGEHYCGDGLGTNISLTLAPGAGCVSELRGCMGLYDRNSGTVKEVDGKLQLRFACPYRLERFFGISQELVPVIWGARHYLVRSDEMIDFCGAVNSGCEPRVGMHGSYLLRRGDEAKQAAGVPAVPEKYRRFLLGEPIEVEIVNIDAVQSCPNADEWESRTWMVALNAGKESGLTRDIKMRLQASPLYDVTLVIVNVEEKRSQGVIRQVRGQDPTPIKGWRFSTKGR